MRWVSNKISPADSSATIAETARPSAGSWKNTAPRPVNSATTMPANKKPPMKLKSRLLASTQADSDKKIAPVHANAIVTTCAPPGSANDRASTGPRA